MKAPKTQSFFIMYSKGMYGSRAILVAMLGNERIAVTVARASPEAKDPEADAITKALRSPEAPIELCISPFGSVRGLEGIKEELRGLGYYLKRQKEGILEFVHIDSYFAVRVLDDWTFRLKSEGVPKFGDTVLQLSEYLERLETTPMEAFTLGYSDLGASIKEGDNQGGYWVDLDDTAQDKLSEAMIRLMRESRMQHVFANAGFDESEGMKGIIERLRGLGYSMEQQYTNDFGRQFWAFRIQSK